MNVSSMLSRIASASPDLPALNQGERSLTYGELNARVDRLASYLLGAGLVPQATVAVCLERSPEWVIAALAIMRAGGAYVPVDLAWPDERLNFVLQDADVSHVIAAPCVHNRIRVAAMKIDLSAESDEIACATASHPIDIAPGRLAYLIYTSGSTGVPKGVEITHANLSHLIEWHCAQFHVISADRASHLAGLSFDAAGWEIWPYLASGASVSMAGEMERTSAEHLQRWMLEQRISIAFVPTVLAPPLCELTWPHAASLRFLLTGGDTLHKRPSASLPFTLVNNYGPTECTVVATSAPVRPDLETPPSIGIPIHGAALYILDEAGAPVERGTMGEIYIGGGGVGRGYRNLPELTQASFLADPFSTQSGARMYRTGDRGLIRPDGEVEFRGRADTQEKIRGQRVELDEISSVLNRHPKVQAAVVAAIAFDGNHKTLAAYIVPVRAAEPTSIELQQFLATSLPAYMVPSTFVRLEALPVTVNGKINRAALPAVDNCPVLSSVASRTTLSPIETRLLAMVRELLATDEVSVQDDFFLIGGHSLLGTQLVLRVRAAFGIDLSLRHLFEAATVERLAATVERIMIAQLDAMTDEEAMQQIKVLA